jgi:hypothetical protein
VAADRQIHQGFRYSRVPLALTCINAGRRGIWYQHGMTDLEFLRDIGQLHVPAGLARHPKCKRVWLAAEAAYLAETLAHMVSPKPDSAVARRGDAEAGLALIGSEDAGGSNHDLP